MGKIINLKAPYLHCFLGAPIIILPIIHRMTSKKYTVRYLVISYHLVTVGCVGFFFVYHKSLNIYISKLKCQSNQCDMYILVSDFFQKNIIYMYLILEIHIVRGECLAFNYVTSFFSKEKQMIIYIYNLHICTLEILKTCD